MSLKELDKNRGLGQQLSGLLAKERLFHAFLFAGGDAQSRKELGDAFAKAILCPQSKDDYCASCAACRKFEDGNQEDLIRIVKPADKASIPVSMIEELQQRLSFRSFGDTYVVIIEEAQQMLPQAQNKLLKTLEEPLPSVVFLLLAENIDALLPTVVSRCTAYWLEEAEPQIREELQKAAKEFCKLILKKEAFYKKKSCLKAVLDAKGEERELALEFLRALEDARRGEMFIAATFKKTDDISCLAGAQEALTDARRCLKQLHNVGYTMKQLCLRV